MLFQRIALGLNETMLNYYFRRQYYPGIIYWRELYNGLIVLTVIPCLQYTTLNNSFKMLMQSNFIFILMTIEIHQGE